jgi:hypothetical protein
MGYFRELPNIEYLSPLSTRNSASEYIEAKNLFKRVKLRDDFYSSLTNFEKYRITEGKRPDHVARELYGSSTLDWVVLISANITNVRDQWPLSDEDIYDFVEETYGTSINETRFYETIEVKDSKDRLILPAGQIVDYNFKLPKPKNDDLPTSSYVSYWDSGLNQTVTKYNITVPITNYEYEVRLNDKKREIYVLKRGYLQQFLNDMRNIMRYSKSSQYVNDKLKRADNIRVKSP